MMKMKGIAIKKCAVRASAALLLFSLTLLSFIGCAKNTLPDAGGVGEPVPGSSGVQISETVSDKDESSYKVTAKVDATDFSAVGQVLVDEIAREWKTYDGMSEESKFLSSHAWGNIRLEADTWDECEKIIGFSVNNPLESLSMLSKTGYSASVRPHSDMQIKHIEIDAYSASAEKPTEIIITSVYTYENVQITLTAMLSANAEIHTGRSAGHRYVEYEQKTLSTGSGIPALAVSPAAVNVDGYYNVKYYDSSAYWVKDNVFYTLCLSGAPSDMSEIQATLDKILSEI